MRTRVHFFHGDCLSYIRLDTRDLIKDDQQVLQSSTPESIAEFIKSLEIDPETKVFLPGIVPPLSVKPIICREHLETWYHCGQIIDRASSIVIAGYSFNRVDEHFNDLFRKRRGATDTKIIVVNPDIDGASANFCNILGQAPGQLTNITKAELDCRKAGNLLFVNATTEQLTSDVLRQLLDSRGTYEFLRQAERVQPRRGASARAAGALGVDVHAPGRAGGGTGGRARGTAERHGCNGRCCGSTSG